VWEGKGKKNEWNAALLLHLFRLPIELKGCAPPCCCCEGIESASFTPSDENQMELQVSINRLKPVIPAHSFEHREDFAIVKANLQLWAQTC